MIALSLKTCSSPVHLVFCEAVLFDLDGTLVESSICITRAWNAWAKRNGLNGAEVVEFAQGRQNLETIRRFVPQLDPVQEMAFLAEMEENCQDGIVPKPGAQAVLDGIPPDRWAVVTSAWRRLAEIRLRCAGLPQPPILVTADEISESKPSPLGYLSAADKLGVSPDSCVVFEDAAVGIEAARRAGMCCIGIGKSAACSVLDADWLIDDFLSVGMDELQQ
jgi:sugar-phosphatase